MSSKGQRKGKRQPKPRPKQTAPVVQPKTPHPVRTTLKVLSGLLVAAVAIYLAVTWSSIPNQVPTTFDAEGTPIAFTSKGYLMACPVIGAMMWILVATMANDTRVWRLPFKVSREARSRVDAIMNNTMVLLTLELEIIFLLLTVSMAASWNPGSLVLTGSLIVVVLTVVGGTLMCYQIGKVGNDGGQSGGSTSLNAPPNSLGRRL